MIRRNKRNQQQHMSIKNKQLVRIGLLVAAVFLLSACGFGRDRWAGVSATENDEIYVSYERFIAKVNPDGERQWTYPASDDRGMDFFAPITIVDDAVFVGDYKGGVHAIDRETGESLWVYEQTGTELFGFFNFGGNPDKITGAVTVADGKVFVPDEEGVFTLDSETGERLDDWQLETDRAVWSQPVYVAAEGDDEAKLFITALDHHVYSLDPDTSDIIWGTDLNGAAPDSPIYDAEQNVLYVGTFGSEIIALNVDDGDIIERFETEGWVWSKPYFSEGGRLFFGDLEGYLYSIEFNGDEFELLWKERITDEGKLRATPLVTDELVVAGSNDGNLYAVDRETGELQWTENIEREVVSDIVQVTGEDDTFVVTATDDKDQLLAGFLLETGVKRWDYQHSD